MKPERKYSKKSIRNNRDRNRAIMTTTTSIQRSLSPSFTNTTTTNLLSPSTATTQLAMLRLGSSDSSIITSSDSEQRVIFSDPCSICGTKKRRISLSPLHHHHQDSSTIPPLFQPNPTPILSSSPSPESTQPLSSSSPPPLKPPTPPQPGAPFLAHLGSFSDSSGAENKFPASTRQSEEPDLVLKNATSSPEHSESALPAAAYLGHFPSFSSSTGEGSPSAASPPKNLNSPPEGAYLGRLGSFSSSSGGGSPASASLPPRPPKLLRSVSDITPMRSSSARKRMLMSSPPEHSTSSGGGGTAGGSSGGGSVSERDEERWKILKDCVAVMNKLVDGLVPIETTEEEEEEEIDNKEVCEITTTGGGGGEEKDEEEGEARYKGSYKCSCGRDINLIFSVLAAAK